MPTYKNTTSTLITAQGRDLPPGVEVVTQAYLNPLPSGVTLVSETPYANDFVCSEILAAGADVVIPETVNGKRVNSYLITVFVVSGQWSVALNDGANTPVIKLGAGQGWNMRCMDRIVKKLVCVAIAGGVLTARVELL